MDRLLSFFIAKIYRYKAFQNFELCQKDLQIVITVPPICTKSYTTMLQNAFHFIGYTKRYSFVRETEAILQYWENKWDTEQGLSDFKKTTRLLLVNLRGRTASITALSTEDGTPRRLHTLAGGGWGGQAVNEEFKQFLIKIVGAPVFLKFVEEEESDWMDLKMKFETIKHGVKSEDDGKVSLRLPVSLREILEECCNENVQTAVQASPYSKKIYFTRDLMRLDVSIIKDLFTNSVEKIISNIKETLQIEAVTGTKTIIMVGGFSESPLVQSAVKEAFPDCNVFVPKEPAYALLKGAVMKGRNVEPQKASVTAVSKFTYGVHVCHINDEHGSSEIEKEETKIFFRKGEPISVGDKVTWKFTLETYDMQHVEIQFFTSPRTDTVSVDESEIEYLEKVRHDFDGLHTKTIKIEMLFHPFCFEKEVMQPHQFVRFL
ncbi:heat shock 70 kDa protein 12A-like [Mercenaria mercenaria]|uniref:heat shock 70 kDa protein 12A-like n=1 Tax=Mercenaria mercenaria TaxID=6596 RepID=UPI00234EB58B|nr:heat shock 70 kDa protein 12A-like [Mercenaria mercenaria]